MLSPTQKFSLYKTHKSPITISLHSTAPFI
jgi:hypothetical protein